MTVAVKVVKTVITMVTVKDPWYPSVMTKKEIEPEKRDSISIKEEEPA